MSDWKLEDIRAGDYVLAYLSDCLRASPAWRRARSSGHPDGLYVDDGGGVHIGSHSVVDHRKPTAIERLCADPDAVKGLLEALEGLLDLGDLHVAMGHGESCRLDDVYEEKFANAREVIARATGEADE